MIAFHYVPNIELIDLADRHVGRRKGDRHVAGYAHSAFEIAMQQEVADFGADGLRDFLRFANHVDQQAKFMRRRLLHGLDDTHGRILAVDMDVDLKGRGIDAKLACLEGRPLFAVLDIALDLADQDRVACARHRDGTVSERAHPLELNSVDVRRLEAATGHLDGTVVDLSESGVRRIDEAGRLFQMIGTRVLVERMGGNSGSCHAFVGMARFDSEVIVVERADDTVTAEAGLRDLSAAFDDLAKMPSESRVGASHQRDRGVNRGVARAPGDHYIGAVLKCFLERLRAHHCDDAVRVIDFFLGELCDRTKRCNLAGLELCLQGVLRLLAPNHCDLRMKSIFGRNLAHDLHQPVDMRITAAAAGRPDENWDTLLRASHHHQGQVALRRGPRHEGLSRTEIIRPRIHRARIGRDQVQFHFKRALDRFLGIAVTEHSSGRQHSYWFHLRSPAHREVRCDSIRYTGFCVRPQCHCRHPWSALEKENIIHTAHSMTKGLKAFLFLILESLRDLAPIILVIAFFQLVVLQQPIPNLDRILVGLVLVLLGLTFFIQGLQMGLFPIGENMAGALTRKGSLFWLLAFAFLLGFGTTVAEPALIAVSAEAATAAAEGGFLASDAESKADYAFGLRMTVAFSVGIAILLGVFRILKGWPIHYLIIGGYLLVVMLTFAAPPEIVGVAYDSGGVTTSTVTVPLVTALGVGLASTIRGRNPLTDGFGLIAFASLTPMIFVLIYGMVV